MAVRFIGFSPVWRGQRRPDILNVHGFAHPFPPVPAHAVSARRAHRYLTPLLLGLMVSCATEQSQIDDCFVNLVTIVPNTVTGEMGDTVRATVALTGPPECMPPGLFGSNQLRWRIEDTLVATVDAVKGIVVARGDGSTTLQAYLPSSQDGLGQVPVVIGPVIPIQP